HQYLDMTIPVDFKTYLLFLKMRYLDVLENQPDNKALITLNASYVDHFQHIANNNEMSTKMHVLAIREKIKNKTEKSLVNAADNLEEKTNQLIRDLTTNLEDHDMEARQMTEREVILMLKQMINASGH
ncbi:conjugal transfer protein, partial [Listeria seeligeri]|nr:conjugal transfer protein [Listeria seeligeri]